MKRSKKPLSTSFPYGSKSKSKSNHTNILSSWIIPIINITLILLILLLLLWTTNNYNNYNNENIRNISSHFTFNPMDSIIRLIPNTTSTLNTSYNQSKSSNLQFKYNSIQSNTHSQTIHSQTIHTISKKNKKSIEFITDESCPDPLWCTIPMIQKSYFHFPIPKDPQRWRQAQIWATNGDQILLQHISKVFPNPFDFLDGDRSFRRLHHLVDIFIDDKSGVGPLTKDYFKIELADTSTKRRLSSIEENDKYIDSTSDLSISFDINNHISSQSSESQTQLQQEDPADTYVDSTSESISLVDVIPMSSSQTNINNNKPSKKDDFQLFSNKIQISNTNSNGIGNGIGNTNGIGIGNGNTNGIGNGNGNTNTNTNNPKFLDHQTLSSGNINGQRVVPVPYNYRQYLRSPIIQLGYTAYKKDNNEYFSGNRIGGNFIDRNEFLRQWKESKENIDIPFITICSLNENWGMLSTMFPNRTAKWGTCCDKPSDKLLYEFLNDKTTLMLVINQHHNMTHPKILTLPRGVPLTWEKTAYMLWDSIRYSIKNIKKQKLLFASASSWGKRPQMLQCISNKMNPNDFEGHIATPKVEMDKTKSNRKRYYEKLSTSMFGLNLPGLGYDCFRMWELLTMGSIVIIEKNIGFDRTLWRLPALIVEDFYDVNPIMLREAYIEALYNVENFEFERLTQSFWFSIISNVSASMSIQPLLDKFPMEAVDLNFARPRVPFDCWKTNTCGPHTKRIPKEMC